VAIKNIHEIFDAFDDDAERLDSWEDGIMFDPVKTENFAAKSIKRHEFIDEIKLPDCDVALNRQSTRGFSQEKITFEDLSKFLSVLKCVDSKFSYPSAGGLYPIDVILYAKEGRVENLEEGFYAYSSNHYIQKIGDGHVPKTAHFFNNREIFHSSAFSIFFFYDYNWSMPKYGGMGYFYGILDAGIILEALTNSAEENGLGSCIIGDMKFSSIKDIADWNNEKVYLCAMEVGYK